MKLLSQLLLPAFVGLRYIRSKRRNRFISFVSSFSLVGMLLGSTALVVVLSVMNGFDREIKQRLLQVIPHGSISGDQPIEQWAELQQRFGSYPGIVHSAPFVGGSAMVSYERGLHGVTLRGLATDDIQQLTQLDQRMILGEISNLDDQPYGVIVGRLLARYLGLSIGDKLTVTLPQLTVTPLGVFPRVKRFTVVGVFEVGAQVDQNLIITKLSDAQKLFRLGDKVTGLEFVTPDMYQAPQILQAAEDELLSKTEDLTVQDWSETQGTLFAAVKMEKTVVSVLLLVIVAIAAFNIVSSLILMVADKRGDIAVLRTLGFSRQQVMAVFVVQGGTLGIVGVAAGALLGSTLAWQIGDLIQFVEQLLGLMIFDPNIYFISQMPSELQWRDVALVLVCGCALSLLATLYPAYQASKIEPAEALRYE